MRIETIRFHASKWNIGQGALDLAGPTILASVALASGAADRGESHLTVGLVFSAPLVMASILLWWRYVPMFAELDMDVGEIRFRNVRRSGIVQLSTVEAFEPRNLSVFHVAVRARLHGARHHPTIRAARYDDFVSSLQRLSL